MLILDTNVASELMRPSRTNRRAVCAETASGVTIPSQTRKPLTPRWAAATANER